MSKKGVSNLWAECFMNDVLLSFVTNTCKLGLDYKLVVDSATYCYCNRLWSRLPMHIFVCVAIPKWLKSFSLFTNKYLCIWHRGVGSVIITQTPRKLYSFELFLTGKLLFRIQTMKSFIKLKQQSAFSRVSRGQIFRSIVRPDQSRLFLHHRTSNYACLFTVIVSLL